MKKLLILATVLALLAILAVPMAAFADGDTYVEGNTTAGSVAIDVPVGFGLGNFVEGWNPASGYIWSIPAAITTTPGTDPIVDWALTAKATNYDGYNFTNGKMWSNNTGQYLDNALAIDLYGTVAGYSASGTADTGVTLNGAGDQNYQLGAAQSITHNDSQKGVGYYFIYIKLSVAVVP